MDWLPLQLSLLSSAFLEIAVLSLLFRFAEASTTTVQVFVPSDQSDFRENIHEAWENFKLAAGNFNNIVITTVDLALPVNLDEFFGYVKKAVGNFEIFVCGFTNETRVRTSQRRDTGIDSATAQRRRSHTISDIIGAVVPPLAHQDSSNPADFRPDLLRESAMKFPELGVTGNLVVADWLTDGHNSAHKTLIVLHETHHGVLKRSSILSDATELTNNTNNNNDMAIELVEIGESREVIVGNSQV